MIHEPFPGAFGRRLQPLDINLYLGASPKAGSSVPSAPPSVRHHLTILGLSDIGRIRQRNEDSLVLAPDLGAVVVADGMGGHPGGDVASRIAADYAVRRLRALLPYLDEEAPEDRPEALRRSMAQSVLGAHHAVRTESIRTPSLDSMGTTLTALAVDAGTGAYAIGHVGDSRAYRLRADTLVQLTRDDTWVQERVEAEQLTPEQARRHPFGHILTQCLGLEDAPEPLVLTGTVENGDVYLLCTDGLVGMLEDDILAEVVGSGLASNGSEEEWSATLHSLVDLAKERGGHDNITVALLVVSPGE